MESLVIWNLPIFPSSEAVYPENFWSYQKKVYRFIVSTLYPEADIHPHAPASRMTFEVELVSSLQRRRSLPRNFHFIELTRGHHLNFHCFKSKWRLTVSFQSRWWRKKHPQPHLAALLRSNEPCAAPISARLGWPSVTMHQRRVEKHTAGPTNNSPTTCWMCQTV